MTDSFNRYKIEEPDSGLRFNSEGKKVTDIPARQARIYWTPNGEIEIDQIGSGNRHSHLYKSGGACWAFWQELSPEALYFRLAQQICNLMICEGIESEKIHHAFRVVPEYRAMLPSHHPDSLPEEEEHLLEQPLPNFGQGYVHLL